MLHAMALKGVIGFFIGGVQRIWRRNNILHTKTCVRKNKEKICLLALGE
jgi:hypothetical protein